VERRKAGALCKARAVPQGAARQMTYAFRRSASFCLSFVGWVERSETRRQMVQNLIVMTAGATAGVI
jgi:hypothetical protein